MMRSCSPVMRLRPSAWPGPRPRARVRWRCSWPTRCAARSVEIISVDSALVYRGMDIGTAKPERGRARARAAPPDRHPRPEQAYSAARFVRDAQRLQSTRSARAAGCRCWWAARCCTSRRCATGWTRCRPPTPALRAQIDARAAPKGWPALHAELRASTRPPPRGWRRTMRSASSARWRCGCSTRPAAVVASTRAARAARRRAALAADRAGAQLARLAARAHRAALRRDARGRLRRRSAAPAPRPATCGRTCRRCAASATARPGRRWTAATLDGLREAGIAATRQLAKRQLTWLRSMADRTRIACDEPGAATRLIDALRRALDG